MHTSSINSLSILHLLYFEINTAQIKVYLLSKLNVATEPTNFLYMAPLMVLCRRVSWLSKKFITLKILEISHEPRGIKTI